jgi:CheY-like chemotaxis protein
MATALVIDDNRQAADSLCQMITWLGVKTSPAYGARAGILALKRERVDIIFLDIHLPGVDGFELLAFFRRDPGYATLPVVVVTSDDQPETIQRAKQAGVMEVIVKPATIEKLEQVLEKANIMKEI